MGFESEQTTLDFIMLLQFSDTQMKPDQNIRRSRVMHSLELKMILPAALVFTLTACSGGGDSGDSGDSTGSAGGSSIMSGTITQFGSVFVNGVKLNSDNASFSIDGASGSQDDLDVGMVVRVTGSVNSDGVTGTADTITFDDQRQGPVSGLTAPTFGGTQRTFTLLGKTVLVNEMDTVFAISNALPPATKFNFETIAQGNNVEISGFFDASAILHATRVELKDVVFDAASFVEARGAVAGLTDSHFTLGGITVNAGAAVMDELPGGLQEDASVEVKGTFDNASNTLTATRIAAANEAIGDADKVSIEGIVRDFVDNSNFRVNGNVIDASAAILTPATLALGNDLRVEVEGPVVEGVLQAVTIELRGGEERIHARIFSIDVENSRFEVMPVTGQPAITVTVNNATAMRDDVGKSSSFGVSDLAIGDFAEVRGFVNGAVVSASRVRIRKNGDVVVQGVRQSDATNGFIKVLGVEFAISALGTTDFKDLNNIVITQARFNQAASANDTALIKIKDREVDVDSGMGNGVADEIEVQTAVTDPVTAPPVSGTPASGTPAPGTAPPAGPIEHPVGLKDLTDLQLRFLSPRALEVAQIPSMAHILDEYVVDRDMAVVLGKALFWDQAAGSDGQACASCHFAAGADNRSKNQLSPGLKTEIAGIDPKMFDTTITGGGGPNYQLSRFDFPFPKTGPNDQLFDDVVGSQGISAQGFVAVQQEDDRDLCSVLPSDFSLAGLNHRQVTGRNAPTVINAVFNHRNFWDGRANNMFNGLNPLGRRSNVNNPNQGIWTFDVQTNQLAKVQVLIKNSSLASQATGPALDSSEMSCGGRTFPLLGRKMLSRLALAQQAVAADDSVLGAFRDLSGQGIDQSYKALIQQAFNGKYWAAPGEVEDGFTQMEANFSLFWGLAIQMYEATLISDMSRFDQFARGDNAALSAEEKQGLEVFILKDRGNCLTCHRGSAFTSATVRERALAPDGGEAVPASGVALPGQSVERMRMGDGAVAAYDGGFYNIGTTRSDMDLCIGANLDGFPLSFSAQASTGNVVDVEAGADANFGPLADPTLAFGPVELGEPLAVAGACKTPTLRNVELTAPYFHNGSHSTLEQVVISYMATFKHLFADENSASLAPQIPDVKISGGEIDALIAFMKTLTDERVRMHQAPFDHPELRVPGGSNGTDADADGVADDEFILIPATGSGGLAIPLAGFL